MAPAQTNRTGAAGGQQGNPLPAVRVAAEGLVQVGKGIDQLSRIIRSGKRGGEAIGGLAGSTLHPVVSAGSGSR